MVDDIEFRDEVDYDGSSPLSLNEIILRQVRKIADICSKEFTGGYWEKKPIKTGNGIFYSEVYHDDSREAYCNAVDFLIDIVYPLSDKELKEYLSCFENYKEDIKKQDLNVDEEKDIKQKIKLKRITFRQINLMFERTNLFGGTGVSNE